MIIDCCADLHGHFPQLEGGDLLIVAGDLTSSDRAYQLLEFGEWLSRQPYKKKVVIAGNHDNLIAGGRWKFCSPEKYEWDFDYLQDSGTEFEYQDKIPCNFCRTRAQCVSDPLFCNSPTKKKLKIWGSPWTLNFPGINPKCTAFTGDEELLASKFALIPDDIDILITHGPPYGVMDEVQDFVREKIRNCGSRTLTKLLIQYGYNGPKLHIFGHIHEGYGFKTAIPTQFINCSHVNERYQPVNKPIRIIL